MMNFVGYDRAARRVATLSLLLPCLLSACGQGDTANSGATAVASAVQGFSGSLRPGLYKVVQTGDAEDETERCITADMIGKGHLVSLKDMQAGWSVVRNSLANGVVDFEAQGPAKGKMTFKGTYTATSFNVDMALSFEHEGKPMTLKNHEVGTFVSADCGEAAQRADIPGGL